MSDDRFAFFGGTVNAKHLACQHSGGDAFDRNHGDRDELEFPFAQQDSGVAEERLTRRSTSEST